MSDEPWLPYAAHVSREDLDRLLRHGHIIPIRSGDTAAFVARHYPGWTWNELLAAYRAAGVVVAGPGGGPPSCDPRVERVYVDRAGSYAVRWSDGRDTAHLPGSPQTGGLPLGGG